MGNSSTELCHEAEKAMNRIRAKVMLRWSEYITAISMGTVDGGGENGAVVYGSTTSGKNLLLAYWPDAYILHREGECGCLGCLAEKDPDACIAYVADTLDPDDVKILNVEVLNDLAEPKGETIN